MASTILPRLALRQSRVVLQRRAASTTTSGAAEAASKGAEAAKETAASAANTAKQTASSTVSKAQQGLSKVTSSAGPALSKVATAASNTVSGIGGRTGQVIGLVQGMIPHVVYYGKVAGELGKLIYKGRNMQPPTMSTVQSYLTPLTKAVRNPSSMGSQAAKTAEKQADAVIKNPEAFLTRLRNLDHATLTTVGITTAEVIGFFSIGEIIGRFKIIGYRSSGAHAEHH